MDDGSGNVSSSRVIRVLVIAGWLASKFFNAHLTKTVITWDTTDLELFGIIAASGLAQNHIENQAPK